MLKYILKRLGISVLILLIVTFVIYSLLRLLPASYVETMAQQLSQTPGAKPYEQWVSELNAQYGLDTGVIQGYFIQLGNMLTGNFGDSWKYLEPVAPAAPPDVFLPRVITITFPTFCFITSAGIM